MNKRNLNAKPVIGVTMGDIAGIGPEIVAKAACNGILNEYAHAIIIGDERVFKQGMKIANVNVAYKIAETIEEAVKMDSLVILDTNSININEIQMGKEDIKCGKEAANTIKM